MNWLFVEFEVNKLIKIGTTKGFRFYCDRRLELPTFVVFDSVFTKTAKIQWTGESWACIPLDEANKQEIETLELIFKEAKSAFFWEISPD